MAHDAVAVDILHGSGEFSERENFVEGITD
jgi:hypothetical protein